MPRSLATSGHVAASISEYDSMPSMSAARSPASAMALRIAEVASARVVLPAPRTYAVSPTPTMA